MQRVKARRCGHELAVQPREAAAAHPRIRSFEHGDTARRLEPDDVRDEARIGRFDLRAVIAAGERRRHVFDERGEPRSHRAAHLQAGELREDEAAYGARADNAQYDFGDARERAQKCAVRMLRSGDADQRGRVSGKHESVGPEVAVTRGARCADADPDRRRDDEHLWLLRKQSEQRKRHDEANERAANPVEAFREHHAALRLHHDEDGRHRGARLGQVELHCDTEREEARGERLEQIDPREAVGARPFGGGRVPHGERRSARSA